MYEYYYKGHVIEIKLLERTDNQGWKPLVHIRTTGEISSWRRLLLDPETAILSKSNAIDHGVWHGRSIIDHELSVADVSYMAASQMQND